MSLNPLFWLHLRIGGSARTNSIIVVAYAAIVIMFTGGSYYIAAAEAGANVGPQTYARVDAAWLVIMTVAQGAFLLLLAPSAIRHEYKRGGSCILDHTVHGVGRFPLDLDPGIPAAVRIKATDKQPGDHRRNQRYYDDAHQQFD